MQLWLQRFFFQHSLLWIFITSCTHAQQRVTVDRRICLPVCVSVCLQQRNLATASCTVIKRRLRTRNHCARMSEKLMEDIFFISFQIALTMLVHTYIPQSLILLHKGYALFNHYGGHRYWYVLEHVVPKMKERGVVHTNQLAMAPKANST